MQQDRTGCAIASVAAIAGRDYQAVKRVARELRIDVADSKLWTDTGPMRRLLRAHDIRAGAKEERFKGWDELPTCALLAIKWHREPSGPAWHWVVYVRDATGSYVLDPKRALGTNRRTDFGRMKPKWFIRVRPGDVRRADPS